jgi:hypothetical protein
VGVISVSDYIRKVAQSWPVGRDTVSDVMSDCYLVCRDKTPARAAATAMAKPAGDRCWWSTPQASRWGSSAALDLLGFDCEKVFPTICWWST